MPYPLTRLLGDGIDYPDLLRRIVALPPEIQIQILRYFLLFDGTDKYDLNKTLRSYKAWFLVSKQLAPQVDEVFWKENTFRMMVRYQSRSIQRYYYFPDTPNAPRLKYMVPTKSSATLIQSVVFRFEDTRLRIYNSVPSLFYDHLELLALLGHGGRFPQLRRLKIAMPSDPDQVKEILTRLKESFRWHLDLEITWDMWWDIDDWQFPATAEALKDVDWVAVWNNLNRGKTLARAMRVWEIEGLVRYWLFVGEQGKWEAIWEVLRIRYTGRCKKERVPWRVKPIGFNWYSMY